MNPIKSFKFSNKVFRTSSTVTMFCEAAMPIGETEILFARKKAFYYSSLAAKNETADEVTERMQLELQREVCGDIMVNVLYGTPQSLEDKDYNKIIYVAAWDTEKQKWFIEDHKTKQRIYED